MGRHTLPVAPDDRRPVGAAPEPVAADRPAPPTDSAAPVTGAGSGRRAAAPVREAAPAPAAEPAADTQDRPTAPRRGRRSAGARSAAVAEVPSPVVEAVVASAPSQHARVTAVATTTSVTDRSARGPRAVRTQPARTAAVVPDRYRASRPVGAKRPADPRHVRRSATMQRAAVLIAPALALTSSLTFALPAQAAPLDRPMTTTTVTAGLHAQTFTVARGVRVPVIDRGTTTVVSYPALVVSGGATVEQTQAALSTVLSAGGDRAMIVQTALQYLGDRYVEGGSTHAGIDCSGLTMVAYQAVGIQLAHYVPTQDAVATTVPEAEVRPGDLVVYDNGDHVGLFLGDGLVLQAPHPGEPVDVIPMFSAAHHFARVLPAGS